MSAPLPLRCSPRLVARAARARLDADRAMYKIAYAHYKSCYQEYLSHARDESPIEYWECYAKRDDAEKALDSASIRYDDARFAHRAIVGADVKGYAPSGEIVRIDGEGAADWVFIDAALDREMAA